VRLVDEVALGDEELYLCVDVDGASGEALVRQASAVDRSWLPPERVVTETVVEFDDSSGKVTARRRVLIDGLVLEEAPASIPADGDAVRVLCDAAATRLDQAFPSADSEAGGFRVRVQCLAVWMPDLKLPQLDDKQLRELLPQIAAGRRSLTELRAAPWLNAMKGLFAWQQLQAIDREAPERFEVPSGSRIALSYEPGRPPILAVRIQEVFGLQGTPRIAGGRIPVLMQLLAPNMRVTQVTDDLESFWANTYSIVRKDLRASYPKHAWPEDPYTATAEHRPKRKK